jgi:hypothetical protein
MTEARSARPTATRVRILFGVFLVSLLVAVLGGAEWVLRMRGAVPWQPIHPSMTVEPGGKVTQPHPLLGYSAIPGTFVAMGEHGVRTKFTNLPNTLRITRPLARYEDASERPQIWIFGCSFTYGSGLADHETYPWRLQEQLPDLEVVNFGMGGYGTVHSFLQFREALKETTPKVAVLAFASLHDIRNTFLRVRRKQVVPYSRLGPFVQPFARLDAEGNLVFELARTEYREFPGMRHSALIHSIEQAYNELQLEMYDSRAVSEALVLEMARLAQEHGTIFIVAGIWDAESMLDFASEHDIANLDISLPQLPQYILSMRDRHPNARAAKIYATRLHQFMEPML